MTRKTGRRMLGATVLALLAACGLPGAPATPSPRPDQPGSPPPAALTVFAAASLGSVLEEAVAAYEAAHPGTTITLSTDSSAALATQIEQGAPVDVFLSADTANPEKLVDAGLVDGDPVVFAGNELTIIVPIDDPGEVDSPEDLARPGVGIIAAGEQVPITRYATQLVDNLAAVAGYPSGFAEAYAANVVSREDNVRAVVAKIELGEGDAGIVYITDAGSSEEVKVVPVPDVANVPVSYAGAVIARTRADAAAHAFLDWFAAGGGQAIVASFGFLPPVR